MIRSTLPVLLLALLATTPLLGGCKSQRGLFSDEDISTQRRVDRYWDGDSARETTDKRRNQSEMGFGFPTGPGVQ